MVTLNMELFQMNLRFSLGLAETNQHELLQTEIVATRRKIYARVLFPDRISVCTADDGRAQLQMATGNFEMVTFCKQACRLIITSCDIM